MNSIKLLRIVYILATLMILGTITVSAKKTRYNAHPDELVHINAFCYFEHHWSIPDLNADDIFYSPDGMSRIYSGEVVYQVYGKINAITRPIVHASREWRGLASGETIPCDLDFRIIRYDNVLLYAITMIVIYLATKRSALAWSVAVVMLCIPQVAYLYSYANSDAWGLSFSIFLFLYAIIRLPFANPSLKDAIIFGVLSGIVLISKSTFWFSILLACVVAAWGAFKVITQDKQIKVPKWLIINLTVCGLAAFIVAAPLRIIYPWSQGDYDAKVTLMRETRSSDGFKPSNPTYETYLLAQKGVPFSELWQDNHWIISSAASFYGLFGYFSIALPTGLYNFALIVGTISLLITVGIAIIRRKFVPSLSKWLFAFSPFIFLINFASSMYHSWTFDYQPQGRYLYGSIVALSLLLSGTVEIEPKWLQIGRIILFFIMAGLSVYILWTYMLSIQ